MTLNERRHDPRTKLNHIAYISFNSGNGAIVLDVSQGGLGFHAAAPVESEELIRFHISGKPVDGIEIVGELAWNDHTKKSGGLRFARLPDRFREQILLSLGEPLLPVADSPRPGIEAASVHASDSVPSKLAKVISSSDNGAHSTARKQSVSAPNRVRSPIGLGVRFVVAMALAAIGVNCVSVFFVRRLVQDWVHEEILAETRNSLLASQTTFHQTETVLRHKADLLSTLAAVTPFDASTLQNSIDDPLINDGSDLVAVTDGANQITALHTSDRSMTVITAEEMLLRSLGQGDISDWWFANGRLYQVVLQSEDHRPLINNNSGVVIVGRQVDDRAVQYLKAISASEVAFNYGGEVVQSTLNRLDQYELSQKLHNALDSEHLQIGEQSFYAGSINLSNGSGPVLRYTVLKSDEQTAVFLNRLNHLFVRLGEIEVIVLLGLAILASVKQRARAVVAAKL